MKKIGLWLLYGVGAYLAIAVLCQLLPNNKPDFAQVFTPNSHIGNKQQGNELIILSYKNGIVRVKGIVTSHAEGPPEHVHLGFDEAFSVESGTLSLIVAGQRKVLREGESYTVPRETYHRFFNETDSAAVCVNDAPASFIFMLSQLYGLIKDDPAIFASPRFLLQQAAWGNDFDSYLKEGPPPLVIKILRFLLLPIAKISGYHYSNPTYWPQK